MARERLLWKRTSYFPHLKAIGELGDIGFALWDKGDLLHRVDYPHGDFDGVGAFMHLLEAQTGKMIEQQPQSLVHSRPGLWQSLSIFCRYMKTRRKTATFWRPTVNFSLRGKPSSCAGYAFSAEESAALQRKFGVVASAFLLHSLDCAANPVFLKSPCTRRWIMPINGRGFVTQEKTYANVSCPLFLTIAPGDSLPTLVAAMKSYVARKLYWGGWLQTQIPTFFPDAVLRYFVRRSGNEAFGLFSHLGNWQVLQEKDLWDLNARWVALPFATGHAPVAATALSVNGRLTLALALHPSLGDQEGENSAEAIMSTWIEKIGQAIGTSHLAKRSFTIPY